VWVERIESEGGVFSLSMQVLRAFRDIPQIAKNDAQKPTRSLDHPNFRNETSI
jgi:hypothetical protein